MPGGPEIGDGVLVVLDDEDRHAPLAQHAD